VIYTANAIILPCIHHIADDVVAGHYTVIGQQPYAGPPLSRPQPQQQMTIIDKGTRIGSHVTIYAGAQIGRDCLIGDGAVIREGCHIEPGALIGAGVELQYEVMIGRGVRIMSKSLITGRSVVGDRAFIGMGVMTANDRTPTLEYDPARILGVTIGEGAMIGTGSIIAPGVHIGREAVIGMGSYVKHDVPDRGATVGHKATIHPSA
jgi:acetyltransferase-like isoleucine patch superfamily enzyme